MKFRALAAASLGLLVFTVAGCAADTSNPDDETASDDIESLGEALATQLTVPSGDVTLKVTTYGGSAGASTLILINGGPGLSDDYMTTIKNLASSRVRVVTYDQRGMAPSTKPKTSGYGLSRQVADLEAIRNRLNVPTLHVLGHSWGGAVALAYAGAHPGRVASLALIDNMPPTFAQTGAGHERAGARIESLQASGRIPKKVPDNVGDDCSPGMRAVLPAYFHNPWFPIPASLSKRCSASVSGATVEAITNYDLTKELKPLTMPTLILFGGDDLFGLQWQQQTAAALPRTAPTRVTLPGCGHYPWVECPKTFYPALRDFYHRRTTLKL